jgi:predicted dehydrogenase
MDKPRVGVVGVGKFGKEHARILSTLRTCELSAIADVDKEQAEKIGRNYNLPYFTDYKKITKLDAVTIAVPTQLHFEIASFFVEKGIHVLVEKPMTKNTQEAERLVELAKKNKVKIQVGHIERFNPIWRDIRDKIKSPIYYIECQRLSPFRYRSADIGVVLDIMLHDIDLVLSVVKSPVKKVDAIGGGFLFANEDIANARIEFEDGSVANLSASRISDKAVRKIRIFSDMGYVSADLLAREIKIYRAKEELLSGIKDRRKISLPTESDLAKIPRNLYTIEEKTCCNAQEPLYLELKSFIDAVTKDEKPVVTGEDGLRVMKLAEEILKKIHSYKVT